MSLMSIGARPIEILLVEDSPDDADLMFEALKEGCWDTHVTLVGNGEDAWRTCVGPKALLKRRPRTSSCLICICRA
jgi:CheY-like chemotaxis protein